MQEAVELRLGQLVGARLLDRVLRRDDQERAAHVVRDAVDGDARLLHDLEQRRLRLGRRAVDLVGEHDRGEDRAAVELEPVRRLVVDRDARDVGRQQVGRELDALARALHGGGERLREARLARAGGVLEQHVALGEHRGQHEADDLALAQHGLVDVVDEAGEGALEPGCLFGGHAHELSISLRRGCDVRAVALPASPSEWLGECPSRRSRRPARTSCCTRRGSR